jgi:hypothetical protein
MGKGIDARLRGFGTESLSDVRLELAHDTISAAVQMNGKGIHGLVGCLKTFTMLVAVVIWGIVG